MPCVTAAVAAAAVVKEEERGESGSNEEGMEYVRKRKTRKWEETEDDRESQ